VCRWSVAGPVHVRVGVVCVREADRHLHGVTVKSDMDGYFFANSLLMNMYLKCSSPEDAHRVFTVTSERNFTMWTTVIFMHNEHRRVAEAVTLFNRTREDEFMPNDVTFLPVLSSMRVLDASRPYPQTTPNPEGPTLHCGGRQAHRGRKVPGCLRLFEEHVGLLGALCGLGALLGACRKHGNDVQLVELAAQRFFRLQGGSWNVRRSPEDLHRLRDVGQCGQRTRRSA
jgi:hypothetical protein